jgi:hypothetical protein
MVGVRRPLRYEGEAVPVVAGDYDHAVHSDHPEAPSFLEPYLSKPTPEPEESPTEDPTDPSSDKAAET